MPDTPRGNVHPPLTDDKLHAQELDEEAIISEARKALEPILRERMRKIISDMAEDGFREELASLIARSTSHVIGNLEREISEIHFLLEAVLKRDYDQRDPADWWRRGTKPEEDEDIPF